MAKEENASGMHHVVPNPDGGWDVRRGGGSRSSGHFDTKQAVVDRGRQITAMPIPS